MPCKCHALRAVEVHPGWKCSSENKLRGEPSIRYIHVLHWTLSSASQVCQLVTALVQTVEMRLGARKSTFQGRYIKTCQNGGCITYEVQLPSCAIGWSESILTMASMTSRCSVLSWLKSLPDTPHKYCLYLNLPPGDSVWEFAMCWVITYSYSYQIWWCHTVTWVE